MRAHILVIDDEPVVLEIVRTHLASSYEVTTETDPEEALRACLKQPPDLVIVDVYMPEMDGLQFIFAVKAVHPDLPIIAMSGGGQLDLMAPVDAAGFFVKRVLRKPFQRSELVAAVADALSAKDAAG